MYVDATWTCQLKLGVQTHELQGPSAPLCVYTINTPEMYQFLVDVSINFTTVVGIVSHIQPWYAGRWTVVMNLLAAQSAIQSEYLRRLGLNYIERNWPAQLFTPSFPSLAVHHNSPLSCMQVRVHQVALDPSLSCCSEVVASDHLLLAN